MLLQSFDFLQCPKIMGYRQWLQQWAFYNTRKFKFTMKSFILDSLVFSRKNLDSWQCPPWGEILTTCHKFYCTHLHDKAISVCMHALVGLETLRD